MKEIMETTNNSLNDPIIIFEEFIGAKLPVDYKNFLKQTNGGEPKKLLFKFKDSKNGSLLSLLFGFCADKYRSIIRSYNSNKYIIPNNMIPIGIDQGSNMILLSVKGQDYGKIYFAHHETETEKFENLILIADSFDEFINNLKDESELEIS